MKALVVAFASVVLSARQQPLFEEAVVHTFPERNETIRYLGLLADDDDADGALLFFGKRAAATTQTRTQSTKSKTREVLVGWRGCDAGLGCLSREEPTRLTTTLQRHLVHNAALFRNENGQLWFLGGRDDAHRRGRRGAFVWNATTVWPAFRGSHPGCEERRPQFFGRCEFDGKFSVATTNDGESVVYARANLASAAQRGEFGGRHVQAAKFLLGEGFFRAVSPFRRVSFLDYPLSPTAADNVYFAAVNPNPADAGRTLLGLFPVSSPSLPTAIALSVSCDGVSFGPLEVLRPSRSAGHGRTRDHPVDGFTRLGENVAFYVQQDVPGIALDDEDAPPSTVVRVLVPLSHVVDLTRRALRRLHDAEESDADETHRHETEAASLVEKKKWRRRHGGRLSSSAKKVSLDDGQSRRRPTTTCEGHPLLLRERKG